MHLRPAFSLALLALASGLAACGGSDETTSPPAAKTDADYRADVTNGLHDTLLAQIAAMRDAGQQLCDHAPVEAGRGWDAALDAAAIARMKDDWKLARTAYERIEGATAPIFPDIDASIDARYDDFMTFLGGAGDADPFDGEGVTGMHAIERILWSAETEDRVKTFEASLPGAAPARFPATEAEARSFEEKLCPKLVADAQSLHDQWTPANIDIGTAFRGLVALMNEQREKVNKDASGEEESRYAQRTMADLRDNLAGTQAVYALFRPWLASKPASGELPDGETIDASIVAKLADLGAIYATVQGDAIPQPPPTWSSESPSAADLATPFGRLYTAVHDAVSPTSEGSVVARMSDAAKVLGFAEFVEGP